jgi:monoamine oxidase
LFGVMAMEDANGAGADSAVISAIQRAIQLKSSYNIRIINLSLGRRVSESYQVDPICQAVEQAWKAGIVVVVAAGNFGRDLAAQGQAAMIDFAASWLGGLYGADIKSGIKRHHATRWNHEPWVLGATSAAVPGGQSARKMMMEPVSSRIFLAGEAVHETLWGTLGGAWESGERAADAALKLFGGRR